MSCFFNRLASNQVAPDADEKGAQGEHELRKGLLAEALRSPVLLLIFNRLALTQQVFSAIRQARPPRLYIAADGPRPARPEEASSVQAVRAYVLAQIDWPCQVQTLFHPHNLGCRAAVSLALDWFFAHEPEGIILEDDCLPDGSFFLYADTLLARYRDDARVMLISGDYFGRAKHRPTCSYSFSRHVHVWGWASWHRAWQHYDRTLSQWPALRNTDWLLTIGDGSRAFQRYWTRIFDATYAGKVDTWDYQWTFTCWAQGGLGIVPACNLVTNLGFGASATHTMRKDHALAALPRTPLTFPLTHPPTLARDYHADRWTDRYVFQIKLPLAQRLLGRVARCLPPYRP